MDAKPVLALAAVAFSLTLGACAKKPPTSQDELDRKFQEMMRGVTLVGRSTRLSDDKIIGQEKYVIEKVSKLAGETWLLQARLQYGGHDWPVPVPVVIKWAGDTPVISLTDVSIPGKGSFTARVVLYEGQYAGTWSAKDHGGQLFGKIVKNQ
jgi:hypothetical protein